MTSAVIEQNSSVYSRPANIFKYAANFNNDSAVSAMKTGGNFIGETFSPNSVVYYLASNNLTSNSQWNAVNRASYAMASIIYPSTSKLSGVKITKSSFGLIMTPAVFNSATKISPINFNFLLPILSTSVNVSYTTLGIFMKNPTQSQAVKFTPNDLKMFYSNGMNLSAVKFELVS